ncbi:MAG TPA: hypothetical protein VGI03_15875 [Verrucomicrobiae bacterium]|jgi:hypothetical protein
MLGALARMKFIRARLVISWVLFAAFLAALWLHYYSIACLVIIPTIIIIRLRIPTPQLSVLERRVSGFFGVVLIVSFLLSFVLPPVLVTIGKILGTVLVLAYGIFTDYSKLKILHDPSA